MICHHVSHNLVMVSCVVSCIIKNARIAIKSKTNSLASEFVLLQKNILKPFNNEKSGRFRKIHYNIISKIALGLRRTCPQPRGAMIGASFRRLLCLSRIKTSYLKWCFVAFYTLARSALKVASFEFANLQCFI